MFNYKIQILISLSSIFLGIGIGFFIYSKYLVKECPPCEKIYIKKIQNKRDGNQCLDIKNFSNHENNDNKKKK